MSTSLAPAHRAKTLPASPVLRERDERLESLKFLVGKLVHDFNNFLVPLLGYVGLLKEELPSESSGLIYADTMESAARKTEGFLDQILTAVRPHRNFQPKRIDFAQLIHSALTEWRNALPAGAAIHVLENLVTCTLTLDETHWSRVLAELLSNARFALATGGTLEIRLEAQILTSEEMLDLNIAEPSVFRLVVRDHGFGMPAAVLRRVCEPFFTTRGSVGAAGLGLTLVHSVAQLHGGQLVIESAEDAGTTVTIWIPTSPVRRSDLSAAGDRKGSILNPLQGATRTKILLVEDDALIREVLKPCLQQTGYDVFLASDGEEGLKLFRRFPRDWALVISDVGLPKINGWDLYKTLRTEDPQVRVVLVTGDVQPTVDEALVHLSAQRPVVLKKPFTLKSFNEVIRTHLGQKP